jgi:hypothetical protein
VRTAKLEGRLRTAQPRFAFAFNWGYQTMTTIQIELPDATAQAAQAAGLLTPEVLEASLCEQLKTQAVGSLRAMWQRRPQDDLTVAQEQMIDEAVQAAHSESRKRLRADAPGAGYKRGGGRATLVGPAAPVAGMGDG